MGSGTSVSRCSLGSASSMGCSVLMLCLHPVLDVPPALGTALSLPPWPALLLCLALGLSPDPSGAEAAGANIPFLLLVAALLCSTV